MALSSFYHMVSSFICQLFHFASPGLFKFESLDAILHTLHLYFLLLEAVLLVKHLESLRVHPTFTSHRGWDVDRGDGTGAWSNRHRLVLIESNHAHTGVDDS